jgi:hypothetical protein
MAGGTAKAPNGAITTGRRGHAEAEGGSCLGIAAFSTVSGLDTRHGCGPDAGGCSPLTRRWLSLLPVRHGFVALLLGGGLAGFAPTTTAATTLVIKGRVIDTRVDAPQFPTSREECTQFHAEVGDLAKLVNEEHEACLADKSIRSGGGGTCTKPGCQKLHDAREELNAARSKGFAACNAAVNERQQSERWGKSTYGTDLDEFVSAVKSGPISAVRTLVKEKINDAINDTFGYASPVVKSGLNVGMATNKMVSSFSKLQEACKQKSSVALNACNKEMLTAIQKLPSRVPSKYRADPGISLIQDAMMARLNLVMRDTLDQVDRVGEQIDEVTEARPMPSRRRRTTPLIENN